MHLKFTETDNGNCRVYYRDEEKRLLCFQIASFRQKTFELLRCSRDGEPSHTIPHAGVTIDAEPTDDSSTAREFAAWWRSQVPA